MKRSNVRPTPGPWKSWPREEGSLITNQDGTEAVCHLVITPREPGKRYPALTDANARLIVVAPDMLAELRRVLALVTSEETNTTSAATKDAMRVVASGVRRVIAKAEGRATGPTEASTAK